MNFYDELKERLERISKTSPLSKYGKAFKAGDKYFFFDSGTGKLLECSDVEYEILFEAETENKIATRKPSDEMVQKACKHILKAMEDEHIYQAPSVMFPSESIEELESLIPQNIRQIVLEVTNRCNLRCDYCIYQSQNIGFRDFGKKDMDKEIAFRAIDLALNNSYRDELYVGFYGGEPLLNFNLIKECVTYVLKNASSKKTTFAMTTNGVLMSKEMAYYFASIPNFAITFSLDGDREVHDLHRKMANGQGSFEATYRGLTYVLDAYKGRRNLISISTVICPPYTEDKFNQLQSFFGANVSDLSFNCTYVQYETQVSTEKDSEISLNKNMPLLVWEKKKSASEKRKSFLKGSQVSQLIRIHNRLIQNQPFCPTKFNGCCLPGTRRLYVTTEGFLFPCERIGKSPDIGNVYTGIDAAKIKKYYIDEYIEKSRSECNRCWAYPLCGVCYANCYDKNGINMHQKEQLCKEQKLSLEQYLRYYCEMSESDPEFIDELNKLVIV